jgi:peptide/nickel transport system substrate-binding protein
VGWIADSAGPLNFVSPLVSCTGSVNLSNFCDRRLDKAMQGAAVAHGPDATERWRRVETSLAAQSPTVPLVNQTLVRLTAKRVGNYQSHPLWGPLLDQMWVE